MPRPMRSVPRTSIPRRIFLNFALVLTAVFHPAMQSQEDAGDEPSARR